MSKAENSTNEDDRDTVRYILITQCLQNDFFLNRESRLRLPDSEVKKILIGKNGPPLKISQGRGRLELPDGYPEKGPLGLFLESTIGRRLEQQGCHGILHVINIRDWHRPGPSYDRERPLYGTHCEEETWGAAYLSGLAKYLNPGAQKQGDCADTGRFFSNDSLRIHHVLSDSVFDFKPHSETAQAPNRRTTRKFHPSELENILDIIMLGSDEHLERMTRQLQAAVSNDLREEQLIRLAKEVHDDNSAPSTKIYLAVIGVYTDIKVKILLASLRARYELQNLAVSDTLTASPALERHLEGLDFVHKILDVHVIHGLNDLTSFLGGGKSIDNELEIVAAERFTDYATYFQDKQNVLAYENSRLQEYLQLTEQRSERVYRNIEQGNQFLLHWGKVFLCLTIILAGLKVLQPMLESRLGLKLDLNWQLPLFTGGLSLLQCVTTFFSRPMSDMQKNLTNLATFRMILESHSLKTALARFHLTTPQTLRDDVNEKEAGKQIKALREQLEVLREIENDYNMLKDLGFGAEAQQLPPSSRPDTGEKAE